MTRRARWLLFVALVLAAGPAFPGISAAQQADQEADLGALQFRPIGPAVMGGRIADIAAVDGDTFYVAAATGNLWFTRNRGTTWEPMFENEEVNSIGDVTVAPSAPDVVWLGTGEANNRQSSPWGGGVYRSRDGGRTWRHLGLADTRHIGRIVVHPSDPDIAWVAAGGNLWAASEERGVFRTRDGGNTWDKVLYVDADTGATDIAIAPDDPDTLIAAMYQRRRSACCFVGGGPGSGLYKSSDGGDTWKELTAGIPEGDKGRIGIDFFRGDGHVAYAIIEAGRGGSGVYRSEDRGETWSKMSDTNPRPMYYSQIRVDPANQSRVYVLGVQLHLSEDGGRTFNNDAATRVHSDHHALWIDPQNPRHLIMGSDGGLSVSFDGAGSWRMIDNLPIGQFYEIGVDLREPYRVYGGLQDNGSWSGPSATLDARGIRNADWFNFNGGDGFYAVPDPRNADVLYGESQNGNVMRMNLATMERQSIRPSQRHVEREEPASEQEQEEPQYRWNWNSPIVVSAHHDGTVYLGANHLLRSRDRGYTWEEISPDLTRAIDRDAEPIMGMTIDERTLSRHDGISSYGNITTVSESPLDAGTLYVGTDDGNVQRTRDGGATWTDLSETFPGLPDRTYVSRLRASAHVAGRVFATFDNHYHGDFRPFVYRSEDHGDTWQPITAGLPEWSVNIITEHPRNADLLFLGNEIGLYVSLDAGTTWRRLKNNLPTVPIDDIVVHPVANDLVLGTHGRSIWILDDVGPLETFAAAAAAATPTLFPVRLATSINIFFPQGWTGDGEFAAPNPPDGAIVRYYVPASAVPATEEGKAPELRLQVRDAAGDVVRTLTGSGAAGMQQVTWDLRTDPPYEPDEQDRAAAGPARFGGGAPRGIKVMPGDYAIGFEGAETGAVAASVQLDPRVQVTTVELEARQQAMQRALEMAVPFRDASRAVARLREQLDAASKLIQEVGAAEEIAAAAKALREEVGDVQEELAGLRRAQFAAAGIERSTTAPTDDQIWSLAQAREALPELIDRLNAVITEGLPALYAQMDAAGVRPEPGPPIASPSWRGQ